MKTWGWVLVGRLGIPLVVVLSGCRNELDGFCDALADAQCVRLKACGVYAPNVSCEALHTGCEYDRGTAQREAIEQGLASFDLEAARRCIDETRALGCAAPDIRAARCERLTVGTATVGDPCGFCAEGLACTPGADGGCGVCETAAPLGVLATEGERCVWVTAGGLGCVENLACRAQVCVPAAGAGASCRTTDCRTGTHCSDDWVCVAFRGPAEACDETLPCQQGLFCAAGVCVAKKADGERCLSSEGCLRGNCIANVCRVPKEGETCSTRCERGLRCVWSALDQRATCEPITVTLSCR